MTEFVIANMAPLMFSSLVVFMLFGYPVAFALAANGLLFGFIGIQLGMLGPELLQALPQRVFGIMQNDTLLAIPFFTFMGLILERSGMAEDLLDTVGQLFGPVRGGVAYAVILVGALLAATTGVVAASVISMALISLPIMLRYGYNRPLACGAITASGTLAQIIPPSLVLIVMADQLGRSVGDMYKGALVPGLMLVGLYMLYVFIISMVKPASTPALPPEARTLRGFELLKRTLFSLVPPLVLIFLVLGTIFMGIATPTEGGAMGACGALILAMLNRRLDMQLLKQAMDSTTKLSCFVMFILIGATVFGLIFRAVDGDLWVEHLLTGMPGGEIGFLILVNVAVFLMAFFLDFFELAFIIVPLLAPVADKLGIDLIWFGVMLSVNMQTSFLTPPMGFALFYLRSAAPKDIQTMDIYRGVIPFIIIQLVMLALLIAFPGLAGIEKKEYGEPPPLQIETPMPDFQAPPPSFEYQTEPGAEKPGESAPTFEYQVQPDTQQPGDAAPTFEYQVQPDAEKPEASAPTFEYQVQPEPAPTDSGGSQTNQ